MAPSASNDRIAVALPVFEDWSALEKLIPMLDHALQPCCASADLVVIDDGSRTAPPELALPFLETIRSIRIVRLRRNLGHQRAIAIGLFYLFEQLSSFDAVVVMDADGEDLPSDIPALLAEFRAGSGQQVVFARRTKRLESFLFRAGYRCYRLMHRLLTGIPVQVGNFSVLPPFALDRLMVVSELWNHYAAAVHRARIPYTSIPIPRGRRLHGSSKMSFVSLLVHGLGAMSVFVDIISARLLVAMGTLAALAMALLAVVVYVRVFTAQAIPGWATYTTGFLITIAIQALLISLVLVFMIISGRTGTSFIPIRDAQFFIRGVDTAYSAPDSTWTTLETNSPYSSTQKTGNRT